ncbi:response regulator transcription factor [uncultured Bdellovibrio sp.]|uniref:response regulator transcription factor n=1 Tax=Bdellovibrio sp. HCB-162 TaxID=3394234 RepID=UPI0025E97BE9|nr:response regulator transcription factor [uncultured Bdellovibrio sp.]
MTKILIVDDQKSVLLTLEALLTQHGYKVTAATNAVDAMRALAAETYDLVITDAIMPGGSDGYSLTRTIRRQPLLAKIPVILLTGKRERSDVEKGIDSGANDYIVKPIDPELLIAKIRNILTSKPTDSVQFASAVVQFKGEWEIKTEVTSISELGLTVISAIPLPVGKILRLNSPIFEDIGIPKIPLRIDSCEEISGIETTYRIQTHFVGVTEKELSPIRLWIRSKKSF